MPPLCKKTKPSNMEEVIGVVMKDAMYRHAGLRDSEHEELEGRLFDHLCKKGYKTKKYICEYASEISEELSEEFFPSEKWLNSFILRFCLIKRKQPKKPNNSEKKNSEDSDHSGTDSDNSQSKPVLNSEDVLVDDKLNEKIENKDQSESNLNTSASTDVLDVESEDQNESNSTIPFTDPDKHINTSNINSVDESEVEIPKNNTSGQGTEAETTEIFTEAETTEIFTEADSTKVTSPEITELTEADDTTEVTEIETSEYHTNADITEVTENETIEITETETMGKKETETMEKKETETMEKKETETTKLSTDIELAVVSPETNGDKNIVNETQNELEEKPTLRLKSLKDLMPTNTDIPQPVFTLSSDEESEDEKESTSSESNSQTSKSRSSSPEKPVKSESNKKIDYSSAEKSYFMKNRADLEVKVKEKINHCTACFQYINVTIRSEVYIHPVLRVLMCKKCINFYDGGDFKKDPDGFDEYCRWCANGGDLLICDNCTNGFCKVCIKRNVGRSALQEVMNSDNWNCYVCDVKPLFQIRSIQRIILEQLEASSAKTDHLSRCKKKEVNTENKFANFKLQRDLYHKKLSRNMKTKEHTDLFASLDGMKDLLSMCFQKLDKIDEKFKKKANEEESFTTARRRFARVNKAMQSNFKELLNNYLKNANLTESEILDVKINVKKGISKRIISDTEETVPSGKSSPDDMNNKEDIKSNGNIADVKETQNQKSVKKVKGNIAKKSTGQKKPFTGPKSRRKFGSKKLMLDKSNEKSKLHSNRTSTKTLSHETVSSDNESDEDQKLNKKLPRKSSSEDSDEKSESIQKNDVKDSSKQKRIISSDNDSQDEIPTKNESSKGVCIDSDDNESESQSILKELPPCSSDSGAVEKEKDLKEDSESTVPVDKKIKADEQLFNSDSSDEDNVNISSAVESILEGDIKPEDTGNERKRSRSESDEDITATKRSKLSLSKDAVLKNKNLRAKKMLLDSSSDEMCSESKTPKRLPKFVPSKETSDKEEPSSKVKKCSVSITRLAPSVVEELDKNGYILYQKVKCGKSKRPLENDSSDSSDAEFKKIMRFRLQKNKNQKDIISSGSDASDEDSDPGEQSEISEKKHSLQKKKPESENNQKLDDISLSENESDESNEDNEKQVEDELEPMNYEDLNQRMKKTLLFTSDEESSLSSDESASQEDDPKKKKKKKKDLPNTNCDMKKKADMKAHRSLFTFTSDEDSSSESSNKSQSDSESDFERKKKKKAVTTRSSSDSDDSGSSSVADIFKKTKNRRRIKGSSSGSDNGEKDNEGDVKETPPNKKKVRKIMKDEDLLQSTKNATQEENSRKERVKNRQKMFEKLLNDESITEENFKEGLVLDFDATKKKKLVAIDERLQKHLKPHQAEGIKFMWDNSIESVELLNKDEGGGGCILAHCMGLGKTLQVIAFVHSLLTNKRTQTQISNILVCCPVNTVYNWVAEFRQWLKGRLPFDVSELISSKTLSRRSMALEDWYKEGGIMIIGYDMYRNLTTANKKRSTRVNNILHKSLVNPGPDLVICDEGHILKNEKTALSVALNKLQTRRRIVLTGTPLQNNLKEYHCMIQFVKPNLLGSRKEYLNRFVNPIEAGQCKDADDRDVRRMKRRAHILHNMLEGCVQRFDYSVIQPFLPPKYEYVISIQMTDVQCQFYRYYLENLSQGGPKRSGSGLFVDFNYLSKIWNHPYVLHLDLIRNDNEGQDEDRDLSDFIDDNSTSSDNEKSDTPQVEPEPEILPSAPDHMAGLTVEGKVKRDWWKRVLRDDQDDDILSDPAIGGKIVLLINILKKCDACGDKLLLFSQSILTLDMIEYFLRLLDSKSIPYGDESSPKFSSWKINRDYLRLDGSTPADIRKQQCKTLNNEHNERCRLFLISTRAGGVGINLVGANRVIIFDSSWNPSHDIQSIFRIYRFGQNKKCFVYRFVAQGTMEEKIYSRQITKLATALRVVDEQQIKRNFRMDELVELYKFTPADVKTRETPKRPEDLILSDLLMNQKDVIVDYHEHDSLLENQAEEELSEEERKAAWEDFEMEKQNANYQQRQNMNSGQITVDPYSPVEEFNVAVFMGSYNMQYGNAQTSQRFVNDILRAAIFRHQQRQIYEYTQMKMLDVELINKLKQQNDMSEEERVNTLERQTAVRRKCQLLEANVKRDMQLITQYTNPQIKTTGSVPSSSGPVNAYTSFSSRVTSHSTPRIPMQSAVRKTIPTPSYKPRDPLNLNAGPTIMNFTDDDVVTLE